MKLAEALDGYAHAIANGADSLTLAQAFGDLRGAHWAHVTALAETEEAALAHFCGTELRAALTAGHPPTPLDTILADPEGHALVAAIHARKKANA